MSSPYEVISLKIIITDSASGLLFICGRRACRVGITPALAKTGGD
jgi:hypothetical protein